MHRRLLCSLPRRSFPLVSNPTTLIFERKFTSSASQIVFTDAAASRLRELQKPDAPLHLRLAVEGGGCSGFQYKFSTSTEGPGAEDLVFSNQEMQLLIDPTSFDFVKGSKVDFTEDLIKRSFDVIDNPNAESGCGCGSSFAAKVKPGEEEDDF